MAASITYNNPLAQWPNSLTDLFGSGYFGMIGGGNRIAGFSDPISGGAANVGTMLKNYGGSSVSDMIQKWSGGNSWQGYLSAVTGATGVDPGANVRDVLSSSQGPAFLDAMAKWEGGGQSALSLTDWGSALSQGFAATGGSYTPTSTGGSGGALSGPTITLPGGIVVPKGLVPGDSLTPGNPMTLGVLTWAANQITRLIIVVLGLIFVAVGLAMFGRPAIGAAVEAREGVLRRRQLKATTRSADATTDDLFRKKRATSKKDGTPRAPRRSSDQVDVERLANRFVRHSTPRVKQEAKVAIAARFTPRTRPKKPPAPSKSANASVEEVMAKLKDKLQAGAKPKAKGEKFGSGMAKGDLKLKLWPDRGAKEHETPPKEIDEATTNLRSRKAKRYKKKQED